MPFKKILSYFVVLCISTTLISEVFKVRLGNAHDLDLPKPTELLSWGRAYMPVLIKGIKLNVDDPLEIEFIYDLNDDKLLKNDEAELLVNYFMAALTIKDEDLWVNLSPYEANRVMADSLLQTQLGQDMLTQDYILKQLSSSMTHPDTDLGQKYWNSSKNKSYNKIWIMPDLVQVYEHDDNMAFVANASLKVKSEYDYLAAKNNFDRSDDSVLSHNSEFNLILNELETEVNQGKNFAKLRQIYYSIILANWFKNKFKTTFYKAYIDNNKFKGIELPEKSFKDEVFKLYVEAFKKGVYKVVKSNINNNSKFLYSSGGEILDVNKHMTILDDESGYDITEGFSSSSVITAKFKLKKVSASSGIRELETLHNGDVRVTKYGSDYSDEDIIVAEVDKSMGVDMRLVIADELKERMYSVDRLTNYVQYLDDDGNAIADKDKLHNELLLNIDELRLRVDEEVVLNSSYENLFYNKPVVVYQQGRLLHAIGENPETKVYPMFVRYKDGQKEFVKNVTFKNIEGEWNVFNGKDNISNQLDFTFFTQLILKDGDVIDPGENIFYYDDIKHLYLMPLITKDDMPDMQDGLMSGGVFWGTSQLLANDARLAAKAYSKPIKLNRNMILTKSSGEQKAIDISADFLRMKLNSYDYIEVKSEVSQQGEYKFIDDDKVEIFLKNSPYPFHAIGIKADGNIIDVCFEGLSSRRGYTIKEVMAIMKELGSINAGILDQGNSVRLSTEDKHMSLSPKYKSGVPINASGTLFYVKDTDSDVNIEDELGGVDFALNGAVKPYNQVLKSELDLMENLQGYEAVLEDRLVRFNVSALK